MKKILIVEDHPLVSESTRGLLLKIDETFDVIIASSAQSALDVFDAGKPWFRIFMDIDVPGAYGLSLARKFKNVNAAKITTIVTALDNPQWREEAQRMGMLGYIIKATPYDKYITSLNSVLSGISAFPDAEQASDQAPQLTRRQLDLLFLLNKGLSTQEIAKQLCVTEGHVNNLCLTLKKALRVNNRVHAISKAVELGYINVHDC